LTYFGLKLQRIVSDVIQQCSNYLLKEVKNMAKEFKTFEDDCACPTPVQAKPVFEDDCACPTSVIAGMDKNESVKMVASNTLNGIEVKVYLP